MTGSSLPARAATRLENHSPLTAAGSTRKSCSRGRLRLPADEATREPRSRFPSV